MWKSILLLTLHSLGIQAGNIYRNEWAQAQYEEPVNQPSYYSQYGPLLQELASYQQKLNQLGLTQTYGHDSSPPFILPNNDDVYGAYQYNNNPGAYHAPAHEHHPTPKPTHKGKHECSNHIVKTDKKNESEHAKKPILEIDIKWPHIKHDKQTDKKHAVGGTILSETVDKISAHVGEKATAIKQVFDKSVDNINKTADGVYAHIGTESSKLIDKINKKLKSIEKQLERLKFGSVKRIDDDNFDGDDDDDLTELADLRSLGADNQSRPNVVHSEIGKKLRSMELLDMDAELRGDLKSSISDAVKKAQEKFNKLIDDQVAKINKKITDITDKFEVAFDKIQTAFAKFPTPTTKSTFTKVYTPPTYKTTTTKYTPIQWKPKATTAIPPFTKKFADKFTTPEYYKYTDSYYKPKPKALQPSGDLNRMDADVDALEIADSVDELPKINADDDAVKSDPSAVTVAASDNDEVEDTSAVVADNAEAIEEADTVKALDDLQSQVVETVKETLKSDGEDFPTIDNNQSEALENPEDKLKSDTSDIEAALAEELRKELAEQDKLLDDNSNVDSVRAENSDDLAKKIAERDEEESTTTSNDSVKSLESINNDNDDEDVEGDESIEEMRSLESEDDNPIDENVDVEVDEDSQLTQPNQAGSLRFDELEVIQLIPVIIAQLREGHVSKGEQVALEKIFGDLWPLLINEAIRAGSEEMNPLLKTLIQSEEVRLAKRDITKQIGNDIYKNSLRRVYRGEDENAPKPYISLDDDRKRLSPTERLLKMVAAVVHKATAAEKSQAKLRHKQKRKNLRKKKNPLGIVTVDKPRQRFMDRIFSINRMKRSIVKFTTDLEDMKSLLAQVNQASDENDEDDETESRGHVDDADDYYYDDEEYQMSPDNDYSALNQLGWPNNRNYYEDYENGSVNEFIQLAKQRDRREESAHHDSLEENYEYDDDE